MVMMESIASENLEVKYHEFSRNWRNPMGQMNSITALEGISFSISEGDVVGIIGRNGAGKSTLMKTMAGLLRPSSGRVLSNGRVILLAGADPGFHPDIPGRQNVLELAEAYGIPSEGIEEFAQSIFEFAGLGDAIDRNVRGYSTGMRGKLGFGFITSLKPEILLIDETLGVGDEEFRKKAQDRLKGFVANSGTVMISTHSLGLARELCNRGILLDAGVLKFDGTIEDTIKEYRKIISKRE